MAMFSALRRHKDTALGISAGMIVLLAAIPSGATPCSAAEENAGQEAELEKVLRSVKRLRLFEYGATDLKSVAPHERPVHTTETRKGGSSTRRSGCGATRTTDGRSPR